MLRRSRKFETLEALETRLTPAIVSVLNPNTGVLSILGDNLNNSITVARSTGGRIVVNGGAVKTLGGTPTVANVTLINIQGQGGNDTIVFNEALGALPRAQLFGGSGNDTITAGSGADLVSGGSGNDILRGMGGADQVFGGSANDTLLGGKGTDQVFGQDDSDNLIWNSGDGSDLNEGGSGLDAVIVTGDAVTEQYTATANGARVRLDRITPSPFSLDIGSTEILDLRMGGGNDTFTGSNGLAGRIALVVDGGAGNDTITGGDGSDQLRGGDGDDSVNGGLGDDNAFLGAGNDTFVWNPGDGSDVLVGNAGNDRMLFNGSNGSENINVTDSGNQVRFTRDLGNITMTLIEMEGLTFNALGGNDRITMNDVSTTPLTDALFVLGADGVADFITMNGTNGDDFVDVLADPNQLRVVGLKTVVRIEGGDGLDSVAVNGLDGDDVLKTDTVPAGRPLVQRNGFNGADLLVGGAGLNELNGGDGDDVIIRGTGTTVANGEGGLNVII